jgi:hypothetical protein
MGREKVDPGDAEENYEAGRDNNVQRKG